MASRTFEPISPNQFAGCKSKMIEMGFVVTDETVTIARDIPILGMIKIVLAYSYDGQRLIVTIAQKPMMVPESKIWSELDAAVRSL